MRTGIPRVPSAPATTPPPLRLPLCPECGFTTPPTPGHTPPRRRRWVPWLGLLAGVVVLIFQWSGTREVSPLPGQSTQWWRGYSGVPTPGAIEFSPDALAQTAAATRPSHRLVRTVFSQRDVLMTGAQDTINVQWATHSPSWPLARRGWPCPVYQRSVYESGSGSQQAAVQTPATYHYQPPANLLVSTNYSSTIWFGDGLLLILLLSFFTAVLGVRLMRRWLGSPRRQRLLIAAFTAALAAAVAWIPHPRELPGFPYPVLGAAPQPLCTGRQLADWAASPDGDQRFAAAILATRPTDLPLPDNARPSFQIATAGFKTTRRISSGWPTALLLRDFVNIRGGSSTATWLDPGPAITLDGPYLRLVMPVSQTAGARRAFSIHLPASTVLACALTLCYAIPWLICYGLAAHNARRWSRSGRCQHCGYTLVVTSVRSAAASEDPPREPRFMHPPQPD